MRILLVQRYFHPDVAPAAGVLRAVAARLAGDGHEVTVLATMPTYNGAYSGAAPLRREVLDGVRVIRLRLPRERKQSLLGRALNMAAFAAAAAAHTLARGRRYDIVVASSMPPVLLAAGVRWACWVIRRPYVYHCQDLYPEAALVSRVVRRGWRTSLAARVDRASVRAAAAVVVLSRDMLDTLEERGLDCGHVRIINNFFVGADLAPGSELPEEMRKSNGTWRVLFAGNLGLVQGLEVVLEAAFQLARHPDIQFAFMGSGARDRALQEAAGPMLGKSVVFFPQQPAPIALRAMREADLGLVCLAPGVARVAYPSKVFSYLAAGCPILAAVDAESELAAFVRDAGVGLTCPPGDSQALAAAVLQQRERQRAGLVQRSLIREIHDRYVGAPQALDRWSALFAELEAGKPRRPMGARLPRQSPTRRRVAAGGGRPRAGDGAATVSRGRK